jgi:hypothetical protein
MRSTILQIHFGNNGMKAYTANRKEKLTTMQILDPLSSYYQITFTFWTILYTQHGYGIALKKKLLMRRPRNTSTLQRPAALNVPPSAQDTCLRPCASCRKWLRWLHAWVHDSSHSDGGLPFDPDLFKFAPAESWTQDPGCHLSPANQLDSRPVWHDFTNTRFTEHTLSQSSKSRSQKYLG